MPSACYKPLAISHPPTRSTYLDGQIRPRLSNTVLKIVGEKDRSRLPPQLRLLLPDILGNSRLTLPMVNMRIYAPGNSVRIRETRPNESLKVGQLSSDVHYGFALCFFACGVHVLPEICHGEDDVRILEGGLETRGVIDVGLLDFNVEGSESLGFGGGRVAG